MNECDSNRCKLTAVDTNPPEHLLFDRRTEALYRKYATEKDCLWTIETAPLDKLGVESRSEWARRAAKRALSRILYTRV